MIADICFIRAKTYSSLWVDAVHRPKRQKRQGDLWGGCYS